MAKSTNFFGLRRGSTKSLTFQVYRGQQITKDRVTDVANPQTVSQMLQRMKLPIVANARATLKTLINHSFEGTEYGNESLKLFSQLNLAKNALTVSSYVPKGAMDCGVSNLIISRGSLEEISVNEAMTSKYELEFVTDNFISITDVGITATSLEEASTLTEAQWSAISALFDLTKTSQVTLLLSTLGESYTFPISDEETKKGYYHNFIVSRLIFGDNANNAKWKGYTTDSYLYLTDGFVTLSIRDGRSLVMVNVGDPSDKNYLLSLAVIRSYNDNGTYKRSTTRLFVNSNFDETFNISYDDAVYSYLKNVTGSDRYLNSGLEGVDITGGNV